MWFRRDLRLSDHPALVEAGRRHSRVVPLFVWDPALLGPAGPARKRFLASCVDSLDRSLDGKLVVRHGNPAVQVAAAASEFSASSVYVTEDFGPYGRSRDREVADTLAEQGRSLIPVSSPYAVAPGTLFTKDGRPFQIFTAFYRAWQERGWESPQRAAATPSPTSLRTRPAVTLPEPGEVAAHQRLERFYRKGIERYSSERDRPDLDSTSRLSAHLRFGCLHPRQLLARLQPSNPSHQRFAAELCWRDFYADVLYHRPDAARRAYRPKWRSMVVDQGPLSDRRFEAWAAGSTGYPIVDAGMRQLLAEGWMPNRVRLLAASFLVKDLHIDWTRGARWFMRHLVDGDLASNQLNWQWVAGSGNDAAPYFRVFNPVTQGRRFDPDGRYVRRWIPEIIGVEARWVHEPWKATPACYLPPLVDHDKERLEALSRFEKLTART
jgi:deoxyribodipyrimidine photo-lyase